MQDIEPIGEPASVGTLIARALHVIGRHWLVFAIAAVATVLFEGAIHAFARVAHADELAILVVPQAITAICYAFAGLDAAEQPPCAEVWPRILERIWAVVILNVALELAFLFGSASADTTGGAQSFFMQLAIMLVMVLLAFSDVAAVLQPNLRMRDVLPFALLRSARLVANTLVWMRVLGLLIADYVLGMALGAASHALSPVAHGEVAFWMSAAANTVLTLAFAVFLALLYLDADLRDRIAKQDRSG